MARLSRQIVGNAGLYFVCYELSKRGWNVLPTARNARGVDIVVYNEDATVTHTVQVKALSKRDAVPLDASLEHLIADFFTVCILTDAPNVLVMSCDEVRRVAHRDGKGNYWLEAADYEKHGRELPSA